MEAGVRTGGCLCGAVRYSVHGDPVHVRRCHCASCRKESGSAFTVYAVWPAEVFELSGEISSYDGRGFCPRCGSRLLDTSDPGDGLIEIRVGSLDEAPFELKPEDETWVKRRESWIPPVEGATQHVEGAARRDEAQVREFARSYTEAWCSHDPTRVADHFATGATITINGGEPTNVTEVARSFIDAFPDIQVFMDDVVFTDETVEYHWTFTGTNTGPGGTGQAVRISGFEEWTFGGDGLVVESRGTYDQDEYERQLEHGAPET